ncbi:MAG: hypothetical protein IIA87_01945 [Nanoarchaeota archaeon]|nr:hypothetical protein [Nanoarchaeota archaeon]
MDCPDDEYDPEVKLILEGLPRCQSTNEVHDLVYNTFVKMFEYGSTRRRVDPGGAGKREDYREMAEQVRALIK